MIIQQKVIMSNYNAYLATSMKTLPIIYQSNLENMAWHEKFFDNNFRKRGTDTPFTCFIVYSILLECEESTEK